MNRELVATYPPVKITVEGMPLKEFFDRRIVDLEKALITCNPKVSHLIKSSIKTNENIRINLGNKNQGH